ncbi:MAG: nitrate- and nitrite sensing domain-containing protein, partial [Acidimicrobiales bacterium]
MVAMVVFASLQVNAKVQAVNLRNKYTSLRAPLLAISTVERGIQNEAAESAYYLGSGGTVHLAQLRAARHLTDVAAAQANLYRPAIESIAPATTSNMENLIDDLGNLIATNRTLVDNLDPRASASLLSYFTGVDSQVQAVLDKAAPSIQDPSVQAALYQTSTALRAADEAAVERVVLLEGLAARTLTFADYATLDGARASEAAFVSQFRARATPAELVAYNSANDQNLSQSRKADDILRGIVTGAVSPAAVSAATWYTASSS